ncbi:sodium- and chloride-dependent neutral and basic amino acid transporter B(0+) [Aplysia californica]|uniref:Transporter n=1 Tax=Aplysia californica TaxID=6500 RepID=A0ABM0JCU4_APLCA|nr:sodium- and chloride-dependent neutral and basic amino acid transporter B(0+) [Aplysia californica]
MTGRGGSYDLWTPDHRARLPPSDYPPAYDNNAPRHDVSDGADHKGSERGVRVATEDEVPDRGQWGNKMEFILSCVGLSVGLGNVWRFPFLAYKNGGAAFLIAYLILQLLIGKPMYFMELVMGQFSAKGPTKVWEMNPSAKGIGIAMCVISLIVAIYYNIIMAYTLFYFFSSMQSTLPWTECKQEWIDEYDCVSKRVAPPSNCTMNNTLNEILGKCACTFNSTIDDQLTINCTVTNGSVNTAAELFFKKEVTQKSQGVEPENMGEPLWKLTLCLLLSWIVVIFCLIKGIKSSGKVVYFTATFPYVILIILLIRGSLLDGAIDGVEFFIVPEWDKLTDISVWVDAAGQMFFSLSVSFGGIIMFGSYNKFKNQVYYDSLIISVMDMVTSIIAGFVVFTTLGGMAKTVGTTVPKVAKGGYGLAFVVYPEALSNLPLPQLWSALFFFMLFTLGLDSEFGLMETVMTCIQDEIPKLRNHKSIMSIVMGAILFLCALPCTCPGGDYVVTIMDHYGADFSVLFLSCFEVVSVMWVYGVMRFLKDIEYMLGAKPHLWPYWVFCWAVTSPVVIALLFTYRMINYHAPTYDNDEEFPGFAQAIGWVLLTVGLCPVPLWFVWRLIQSYRDPEVYSTEERLQYMFSPTKEWVPNDGQDRYLVPDGTAYGSGYAMSARGADNPAFVIDNKY